MLQKFMLSNEIERKLNYFESLIYKLIIKQHDILMTLLKFKGVHNFHFNIRKFEKEIEQEKREIQIKKRKFYQHIINKDIINRLEK